jgi:peptidoglycan hydrolase CwlO-like protein
MKWLRHIGNWTVVAIVIVCVAIVFNALGKGFLDSSDDSVFFAIAATVVTTFLYKRHAMKAAGEPVRHGEVVTRAVIIGIILLLLTIPSKIRTIRDATSDASSIHEEVSSLQDDVEELKNQIDSIENESTFR